MTTIVTRTGKGSPLTHVEVDNNFTNLNTNKLETAAIPLGTFALPSISFLSDANTGIYSPGADQVAVATNGTEKLIVLSNGNVGIGSSSPSAKLDVEASNFAGGPAIGVRFNASNVRLGFNIANSNGYTYIGCNTNNKLSSDSATYDLTGQAASQLRLDGGQLIFNNAPSGTAGNDITFTNRLTIASSGLVGIGTASPGTLLDVFGVPDVNYGNATLVDSTSTAANVGGVLTLGGYKTAQSSKALFGSIKGGKENATSANDSGYLAFSTNNNTTLGEKARIDSSGRLLVGTDTAYFNGFHNAFTSSQLSKGSADALRCVSDTRTVEAVNNSTVDVWVGRTAAGNPFNNGLIGHFYVIVGGGNALSGVYSIVTTGNGTSSATLTAVSTVTRGTSPVSSVQIANDGGSGAIKLTITYINNAGLVNGLTSYVSFVGLGG